MRKALVSLTSMEQRIAFVAEYNAETRLAHKVFKLRHQRDITVLFADNEQPVLVV